MGTEILRSSVKFIVYRHCWVCVYDGSDVHVDEIKGST